MLLVCSSWVPGTHKTEQWLALNAARAIENSVYVAGVCQTPPVSAGRSLLVDPMGYVEADLGPEPGVRSVDVSLGTVARVREQFPMFRHGGWGRVHSLRHDRSGPLLIGFYYSQPIPAHESKIMTA